MKPRRLLLCGMVMCAASAAARAAETAYELKNIPTPPGLVAECGGLSFSPSGKLYSCWHRGEVYRHDPADGSWTLYAAGLHDPLGIAAISDTEVYVLQRAELTLLRDTDGDGAADAYDAAHQDFGVTGNYHEFSFGPAVDARGRLHLAHGLASGGGGNTYRHELRGPFNPISSTGSKFSCVPWRGWVCRVGPEGESIPLASGFREPNGIGFDLEGNLWVADNQGDWVGTSKLYHVRQGRFYGHPSSLAWRNDLKLKQDPIRLPVEKLQKMRTRAAVLMPHGILANSPTEPVVDKTGGKFGPFAGQLFLGEMNAPRIIRVMLDKVGDEFQGSCTVFYEGRGLRMGNNRMAFGPDHALWIGQTERKGKWIGGEGIQRLSFTGNVPMAVRAMRLTKTGFDLEFTKPVDPARAARPEAYAFQRYHYKYHAKYGSDQSNTRAVAVSAARISDDGNTVSLQLADLTPDNVYELKLVDLRSADGAPMTHTFVFYTLNRLVE